MNISPQFYLQNRKRLLWNPFAGITLGLSLFIVLFQTGFYEGAINSISKLKGSNAIDTTSPAYPVTHYGYSQPPELKLQQEDINRAVGFYQHTLPVAIRSDIRLDKVEAKPYQLHYTLTLLNYRSSQLNTLAIEKAASRILEQKLCATQQIRALMDKGLTVRCLYRGRDLSPVASVVIQNTSCLH